MHGSSGHGIGMSKHRRIPFHGQPIYESVKIAVRRFVAEMEAMRARRPRAEFYASIEELFRAERGRRKVRR